MKPEIFFFGAPGNGFEAYPKKYVSSVSAFDRSDKSEGDLECLYMSKNKILDIIYIIYGLGGDGDGSYRKGRNFGVGIRLSNYQVISSERKNLFEFLNRFVYEGVNQSASKVFKPNDGKIKDFAISSFQDEANFLDILNDNLSKQFMTEFGESLQKNTISESFIEELDPQKNELKNKEGERIKLKEEKRREEEKTASLKLSTKSNPTNILETDPNPLDPKSDSSKTSQNGKIVFNAWYLAIPIAAILVLSCYNFYKISQLNKELKKTIINLSEITNSGRTSYRKIDDNKILKNTSKNGKKMWYLVPKNIKKMVDNPNPEITSLEAFLDHLAQIAYESKELQPSIEKIDIKSFIFDSNKDDIKNIKSQIDQKLESSQSKGVFFSDIQLSQSILIWQE
jgi:hypothetical protein